MSETLCTEFLKPFNLSSKTSVDNDCEGMRGYSCIAVIPIELSIRADDHKLMVVSKGNWLQV